jgi:hypothetical protein
MMRIEWQVDCRYHRILLRTFTREAEEVVIHHALMHHTLVHHTLMHHTPYSPYSGYYAEGDCGV